MKIVRHDSSKPLPLTNDGELEIFFLGVGSAFALRHFQTSIIIVKGDTHVLVDFGMYGPLALKQEAGLTMSDVGIVLPTHSHADHVGGFEALALWNRYVGMCFQNKPKLKMIVTQEYQRILWDRTLQGGLEWNEEAKNGKRKLSFSDFFDVIRPAWKTAQPREIHEVQIGDLKLDLFRTNHIPEQADDWEASFVSYGLFIDERVFFSGDTQFDPELIDLYKAAEFFFHDVQFFPGAVHAPLEDLKTLPTEIKKRMCLMHFADDYDKHNAEDFYKPPFGVYAQQGCKYIF